MADCALKELSKDFNKMYSPAGWPSIPPGKLIRAQLLRALYSIRSERLLIEQLDYNLLFRWFVGLGTDEDAWDPASFSTSCERLLRADFSGKFFARIRADASTEGLLSDEHFTVDATLMEALAEAGDRHPQAAAPRSPGSRLGREAADRGEQAFQ